MPVIKKITSYSSDNLSFIYCAERNNVSTTKVKRREENIKALGLLACKNEHIIYLNDYFRVDDLQLVRSASDIYSFTKKFINKNNIKQIITLNLEGGHPDHDSLALIIEKIAYKDKNLEAFYVPAYNNRVNSIFPVSVFRPLKKQNIFFKKEVYSLFIWMDMLGLAFIYKSERSAFLKLLPFIIFKSFLSRSIYVSQKIDIKTIDWDSSLTLSRYSVKKNDIIKKIEDL